MLQKTYSKLVNGINMVKIRFFKERDPLIDPQSPIRKIEHPPCKNPNEDPAVYS